MSREFSQMGRSYSFECDRCGFRASVSGGEDRGAQCFIRTCRCLVCKNLFDAVTHIRLSRRLFLSGAFADRRRLSRMVSGIVLPGHLVSSGEVWRPARSMVGRLLPGGMVATWVEMKLSCPESSMHKIQAWEHPGPCPKCGIFLEKTTTPSLIWE